MFSLIFVIISANFTSFVASVFVKSKVVLSGFCWFACSDDMKCCRNVPLSIGAAMISSGQQLILERTRNLFLSVQNSDASADAISSSGVGSRFSTCPIR